MTDAGRAADEDGAVEDRPQAEDPAVELARLREENARLRGLLGLDDRPADGHLVAWSPNLLSTSAAGPPVDAGSSDEAKLELFRSLFGARSDVYALRWENPSTGKSGWSPATHGGWSRQRRSRPEYLPLSDEVFALHLRGQAGIATTRHDNPKLRATRTMHAGPAISWNLPDGRLFALDHDGAYTCPRCLQATMSFVDVGCFD